MAMLEVLVTARRWIGLVSPVAMAFSSKGTVAEMRAFVEGITNGDEIVKARDEFVRAATNARLLVADIDMQVELDAILASAGSWVEDAFLNAEDDARGGSTEPAGRLQRWLEIERTFKGHLTTLENLTASVTSVTVRRAESS